MIFKKKTKFPFELDSSSSSFHPQTNELHPTTTTRRSSSGSNLTIGVKQGVQQIPRYWRWLSPNESAIAAATEVTYDDDEDSDDTDFGQQIVLLDDMEDDNDENLSLLLGNSTVEREVGYEKRKRRQRSSTEYVERLWKRHLLPEGPWMLGKQTILDAAAVKLFKFFLVSVASLLLIHYYAIVSHADRDETYGLREMLLFDGNHIALDLMVFFVVGRLYVTSETAASVDSLGWIVPSVGSAIALSLVASHSNSLHHSITAYEMHCTWTWQFWAVILCGALPTIVGLVTLHLVHAARQKALLQKLLELSFAFLIFLAPYVSNSFFHLHHWYYAWVLGMHANAHTWWSRLTMSMLFGLYLNGIAIFGRDPVMTCAVTLYQSQNQQCPYLGVNENFTLAVLSSATELDWHNCSAMANT